MFRDETSNDVGFLKRSLIMLQKIRKLLCIHSFEYEIGQNIVVKECRKCGAHH